MKKSVKYFFPPEDLKAIADAIGEAEKTTLGEIRVDVRQRRNWLERKFSVEAMARREFKKLGMMQTKQRTGILIFLLLQDRAFYILADEGIHRKVEDGTWDAIAGEMSKHFSQKNFRFGIIHGVKRVGEILTRHFPEDPKDKKNELPNEVSIR